MICTLQALPIIEITSALIKTNLLLEKTHQDVQQSQIVPFYISPPGWLYAAAMA